MNAEEVRKKQAQLKKVYKDETYEHFKTKLENTLNTNPLVENIKVDELSYYAQNKLKDEGFTIEHYSPDQRAALDGKRSHYIISW